MTSSRVRVEFGRDARPTTTIQPQSMGFHVLAKPSGAICNLDCTYCFFLEKADLYPGGHFRMEPTVLERYLAQLLEIQRGPEITIAWQGGEPTLLGVEWFRHAVEVATRVAPAGTVLQHTIQTNATLITDEWAEFFVSHGFLVGVSIDGPPSLHDVYRVDKRGRPTAHRVVEGLRILQRHGVEVNALVTVNAANEDHGLEVYRYLRDELQLSYFQLIPIVELVDGKISDRSVAPAKWGMFLNEVFEEWLRHDVGTVFVSMIDAALAPLVGAPAGMCIFAETCGDAVALEHNGDLYSCDHFVDPEHLLGNIQTTHLADLVASPQQRNFGLEKREGLPSQCRRCPVLSQCRGECPKNRTERSVDGEANLNYLCEGYLGFFSHVNPVLRMMATALLNGGYADEIPDVLFNGPLEDPCPCQSGRPRGECHRR